MVAAGLAIVFLGGLAFQMNRMKGKKLLPAPKASLAAATDQNALAIFFASQKGHSKRFAESLVIAARDRGIDAYAVDLANFDTDRLVEHPLACFIVATYAGGTAVPGTEPFFNELTEMSRDFRVEKTLLAGTTYAVFGCGNSEYPAKDFNACARRLDRALRNLGAKRLLPSRYEGDDIDNALTEQFEGWLEGVFMPSLEKKAKGSDGADSGRSRAHARRLERMRQQGDLDAAKAGAGAAARRADSTRVTEAGVEAEALTEGRPSSLAAGRAGRNGEGEGGGECCNDNGDGGGECCGGNGDGGGECCGSNGGRGGEGGFDARGEGRPTPRSQEAGAPVAVPLPFESDDEESEHGSDGGYGSEGGAGMVDVEDLGSRLVPREGGGVGGGAGGAKAGGVGNRKVDAAVEEAERKPMVTPSLAKSLGKQGYKIVGTHSGVKLCRWTKAMLRGRGGCYKHTFYGIVSYQCMEATPSLACANKCVFCWRHHDNPVGTSFRWKVDHPQELIDGFEEGHKQMIKQMRGVPGVLPERFAEACKTVRHCALSLVGEPIIYPRINELLDALHGRGISSFMVTNAQFPDQMDTLKPCTQLYISVDAPTPEELKAVDRPLFPDFWERFLTCVDMLKAKRQRTVFRLTLVNGWNTEQLSKYVDLVRRGQPDFIEVKGVTYCGDSKASPLTIKHCPYHAEVRAYCAAMVRELGEASGYELASEHAHSNIVLIASNRFKMGGTWHTWIDYDKFTRLANSGEPFGALDYCAPTPEWAVYDENAADGGFDPGETRFVRKGGATAVTGGGC